MSGDPLRIGVLGAANISHLSIVEPARATGHRLVACAARDPQRAAAFAAEHGVERVLGGYEELLEDPEVEAIYNPLPNSAHAPWNLQALAAGKHVLSEKPSASNAEEARTVRAAVDEAGLVFMEAFHYPYHPRWHRLLEILRSGEIGDVQHITAPMAMTDPGADDIRWRWDLAGGAVMDLGCYSLSAMRLLGEVCGGAPRIVAASATPSAHDDRIDAALQVTVEFPAGATGIAGASMIADEPDFSLDVTGTLGSVHLTEFCRPHLDDGITVRTADGEREEHLGRRSSYTHQLDAFAAAVREGVEPVTGADFAVTMMETIDASYRAAGLPPRATASA